MPDALSLPQRDWKAFPGKCTCTELTSKYDRGGCRPLYERTTFAVSESRHLGLWRCPSTGGLWWSALGSIHEKRWQTSRLNQSSLYHGRSLRRNGVQLWYLILQSTGLDLSSPSLPPSFFSLAWTSTEIKAVPPQNNAKILYIETGLAAWASLHSNLAKPQSQLDQRPQAPVAESGPSLDWATVTHALRARSRRFKSAKISWNMQEQLLWKLFRTLGTWKIKPSGNIQSKLYYVCSHPRGNGVRKLLRQWGASEVPTKITSRVSPYLQPLQQLE